MTPRPVPDSPTAALRYFANMQIVDAFDHPETTGVVLELRPVGHRGRRWLSITAGPYGLSVSPLREGCRTLTQVAARRFDNEGGAA